MRPSQLTNPPSEAEVARLDRDGATVLRGVIDLLWIESMRSAIDHALGNPSPISR